MSDWKPDLYLQFSKYRTQPAIDLVTRIGIESPKRILDVGCGPGNSTAVLKDRWPEAEITGLDSSAAMIAKASASDSGIHWVCADASGDLHPLGTFDVVFSNAAIQWMPAHDALLRSFFALLAPGGTLAVQVPDTSEMPIHIALQKLVNSGKWSLQPKGAVYSCFSAPYYYDIVCSLSAETDLWETRYYHSLDSHHALVEWFSGAGLRPYANNLQSERDKADFLADFECALETVYPKQRDGRVLFPFHRVFFIVRKARV